MTQLPRTQRHKSQVTNHGAQTRNQFKFPVNSLKSGGLPPKQEKNCGPPCLFPSTAKHSCRGRQGFPAVAVARFCFCKNNKRTIDRKTGIGVQSQSPVFGVEPLKSGGLPPKPKKFCGPPRLFPITAKHPRRWRQGFPAKKTGIGAKNQRPVFRGQPPEIRPFTSKTGKIVRAPLPLSEERKKLAPGARVS